MTLEWPLAIVLVVVIFLGVVVATAPANRRSRHELEEMKAKYNEQFQTLAADYATLAVELRDTQVAMQADLARLAASVESIEAMMREVG
jgi:Skp family chaperone for outer membrane proteins